MTQALRNIRAIVGRELRGYFASPVAYVFIVIFLVLTGFFTFMVGQFFARNEATLSGNGGFFFWHPWLYLILVPAVGMRLWAEEQRSGTMELLFTWPISIGQAILGKYLAGVLFLGLTLGCTFPIILTVNYLGDPDNGVILCGYLSSFLVAIAFLAVSCLTSALTRNQVVSFILSLVACLLLIFAGWRPVTDFFVRWTAAWLVNFVAAFSVMPHYEGMQRGVLDLRDLIYYASLIVFMLVATGVVLRGRRSA